MNEKIARYNQKNIKDNKRCFRAEGFLLLPSALRPRLLNRFAGLRHKRQFCSLKTQYILISILLFSAMLVFPVVGITNVSAASLTLTISNNISLDITPSSDGNFVKSSPSTIKVKTNDRSGYTLSIKGKGENNNLISGQNQLASISSDISEDTFRGTGYINQWGFSPSKLYDAGESITKNNTYFLPGPTSTDTVIDQTLEANEEVENSYDIVLGAKVDNTLAAGVYNNSFIVSAMANDSPYMQEWDGCDSLGQEETTSLIDFRDGNEYTIAKLKDGKCWMTKNLLISGKTLTEADSDVDEDYELPASSGPAGFKTGDYDKPQVYVSPDSIAKDYGAYYNWNAATAGDGTYALNNADTRHSVCPRGWKLPSKDDFQGLINNYSRDELMASPANFLITGYYNDGTFRNEAYSTSCYGEYLSSTPFPGGGWSNDSQVYFLFFCKRDNLSLAGNYKSAGLSVRCVVRE